MSDVAVHEGSSLESTFKPATMLLVTAIGVLAFIAMLVLGAYAPDLRSGHNGGSHALSNGATGFSGLVRLAEETQRNPMVVRTVSHLSNEDLAVITPDDGSTDLSTVLATRGARPTLIVLPKWSTMTDPTHAGWVRVVSLSAPSDPERTLYPAHPLKIARAKSKGEPLVNVDTAAPADLHFLSPAVMQTISGNDVTPLITTAASKIVLGRISNSNLYVLSDPDLLNNHGMGDERQARAALSLLDYLNSTDSDGVLFDVTANGLGRSKSPLKLAFDPPFLGVTLTIFVAILLAGWQALNRFGPIRHRERALAFGKEALVDNSAALIRRAGREARLGSRYVEVIRERAITLFRLPPTLSPEQLAARLEAMNPHRSFAATAEAAVNAGSREELLRAAQSLNHWLLEVQQ